MSRSSGCGRRGRRWWTPALLLLAIAACGDRVLAPEPVEEADPPLVLLVAPEDEIAVNRDRVRVSGTASAPGGRIVGAAYSVNDGPAVEIPIQPGATVEFAADVPLSAGGNLIAVRATTAAGAVGTSQSVRVTLDTVAPTLTIRQPTLFETRTDADSVRLFAHATDAAGIERVVYSVNGGPEEPLPLGCSNPVGGCMRDQSLIGYFADVRLEPGLNVFSVTAVDLAGNREVSEVRVIRLPRVRISAPAAGAAAEGAVRVTGTVSYPVPVQALSYRVNGGAEHPLPVGSTFDFTAPLGPGANLVEVIARDGADVEGVGAVSVLSGGATDQSGPFRQIAAGRNHSCGIEAGGRLYCWGRGLSGALGTGRLEDETRPVPVASTSRFRAVTAGSFHT